MTAARDPVLLDDADEVSRLLSAVDFVLTDCDGVIYLNNTVIAGTTTVFAKLREMGKKILFVSNNSSKSRKAVLKKLNDMGFQASLKEVFVSAYVVAEYFKSHNFTGKVSCCSSRNPICSQSIDHYLLNVRRRCTFWDVRA